MSPSPPNRSPEDLFRARIPQPTKGSQSMLFALTRKEIVNIVVSLLSLLFVFAALVFGD